MSHVNEVRSPQDPYASFLVAASAGSGKTYQLSRRFLHLVGAGAKPGSILTVTFTKKAAGEMRARILEEAARLTVDSKAQARFAAELAVFHEAARARGQRPPPPRTAAEVGHTILSQSQSLTISTIDSLFVEWLRKFPYEASPEAEAPSEGETAGAQGLPSPFSLLDPVEERELRELAWSATCQLLARALRQGEEGLTQLLRMLPGYDVRAASSRVFALDRLETYLWYAERHSETGNRALATPTLAAEVEALAEDLEEETFVERLAAPLTEIARLITNDDRRASVERAIQGRDFPGLFASGLITKTYGISGSLVRGKKREQLAAEINTVEQLLRAFVNKRRIEELARHGDALYDVFRIYRQLRDHLKFKRGLLEFRDLAKGAYRLFRGDAGLGARLLLARTVRHVMLDEFQDTSRLQWGIFAEMASSMLAGAGSDGFDDEGGGPEPSVFIVGDVKQSIYGFREADPTVMNDAAETLAGRLELAPLNDSYRTAQVVLDFVNEIFATGSLPDFPPHRTAAPTNAADGTPVPFVPDVGRVLIAPLVETADADAGEEREAELVAEVIDSALRNKAEFPVYDKASGSFRALSPGDVAILYRSTTKAALFENALRKRGIPCQREEARGFFKRPEIADALALLRYLALPADLVSLCTVLRSPMVGLADEALLRLLAETKPQQHEAARARLVLDEVAKLDPELGNILLSLGRKADTVLPHTLLAEALARLDAFGAYGRPELYAELPLDVAASTEAPLARRNLVALLEMLLKFADDGMTSLAACLRRLETLAANDETGNAELGAAAVTLMTIHKAKGLEFPLVAVVDAGRPWGRKDLHWLQTEDEQGRPTLSYIGRDEDRPIDDPLFDELLASAARQISEECFRLLYVALTRARQYLLITGHQPDRRVGLAETVLYEPLRQALESSKAGRTVSDMKVGSHQLRGWATDGFETITLATPVERVATSTAISVAPRPDLPREMRVVSPSRHETTARLSGASTLAVLPWGESATATAVGTYLHAAMEALVLDQPFDRASRWQQLAPASAQASDLVHEVDEVLSRAVNDKVWNELKASALRLETELPLVHQADPHTLVRGTLDLLVELPGRRLLVIDYKATRFVESDAASDAALARFASDRGWREQLEAYAAALRALHPGYLVEVAVYFLSLGRLLRL